MLICDYDYEMDIAVQREEAAKKAAEEARKKVAQEAEAKERDTLRNLKSMGVSIENLAKATGLSIEEIKAI